MVVLFSNYAQVVVYFDKNKVVLEYQKFLPLKIIVLIYYCIYPTKEFQVHYMEERINLTLLLKSDSFNLLKKDKDIENLKI